MTHRLFEPATIETARRNLAILLREIDIDPKHISRAADDAMMAAYMLDVLSREKHK